MRLDSLAGLQLLNVPGEVATYRGRRAVRLIDRPRQAASSAAAGGPFLAILTGSDFRNGTIEVEVAGAPRPGASETARGFIGIAFRVQPHGAKFECLYLRPTNGRADDQLRRNHSVQYVSYPDFPWDRLRREFPGQYESYTDLEPGTWTKMKIVVTGIEARLYVQGANQPALIVNDLKLGETHGQIALWISDETDGYFSNLTVR
ncbi:MAG: hypothetical protein M3O15_14775 [Acidobacteriota bacterium]|nr:hypothetical protein [Acidobacteriota bacterium]